MRTHLSTIYRKLSVSTKIKLLRALESTGAEAGTEAVGREAPSVATPERHARTPFRWSACRPEDCLDDVRGEVISGSNQGSYRVLGAKSLPLLLPTKRPVPQHLGKPEALRLPPVQNSLHDVRR